MTIVDRALAMDRQDQVTRALAGRIADVRRGKRPQPRTMPDHERS